MTFGGSTFVKLPSPSPQQPWISWFHRAITGRPCFSSEIKSSSSLVCSFMVRKKSEQRQKYSSHLQHIFLFWQHFHVKNLQQNNYNMYNPSLNTSNIVKSISNSWKLKPATPEGIMADSATRRFICGNKAALVTKWQHVAGGRLYIYIHK